MTAHLPPNHDNRPQIWSAFDQAQVQPMPKNYLSFEMDCGDGKNPWAKKAVAITPDGKVWFDWDAVRICAGRAMPKRGDESEEQALAWALLAAHGDKP